MSEYDPAALARHELHITLMRFNLGELDVVKNQAGADQPLFPRPGRATEKKRRQGWRDIHQTDRSRIHGH